LDSLTQFEAKVDSCERTSIRSSPHSLVETLGLPNHHPEENLFIAEKGGRIVGYMDLMAEKIISRAVLSCFLCRGCDGWDLFKSLVERALFRAQELQLTRVHVNIPREEERARSFFSEAGFCFIRRFIELKLDLSKASLPDLSSMPFQLRSLRRGEEEKLTHIQNRSFTGMWGYNPNTNEEVIYRTRLPHRSPRDIILAYDKDKPIGYCWTRVFKGEGSAEAGSVARIDMLGVDPDHRGKGVGSAVLAAGLSLLRQRGVNILKLTVDSENDAALALYSAAGFEVWKTTLWYENVLG
jgi:mycothiol synthase